MRTWKTVIAAGALSALMLGVVAFLAPAAVAAPDPPGCSQGPCKPFVRGPGGMKCYFVGCDVDGICRYIC